MPQGRPYSFTLFPKVIMYGLDTQDIEAINKVFSIHPEIEKAVLYGSRAKGNYRKDSDIDLTLKGGVTFFSFIKLFLVEMRDNYKLSQQ